MSWYSAQNFSVGGVGIATFAFHYWYYYQKEALPKDSQICQYPLHGLKVLQDGKHSGTYAIEQIKLTDKIETIYISGNVINSWPTRMKSSFVPVSNFCLTLNLRGPSYFGLTRSISWLLMPWLLTSPGHQQPWYWLHRICRSFAYLRKGFKYLCYMNVEEWHKM